MRMRREDYLPQSMRVAVRRRRPCDLTLPLCLWGAHAWSRLRGLGRHAQQPDRGQRARERESRSRKLVQRQMRKHFLLERRQETCQRPHHWDGGLGPTRRATRMAEGGKTKPPRWGTVAAATARPRGQHSRSLRRRDLGRDPVVVGQRWPWRRARDAPWPRSAPGTQTVRFQILPSQTTWRIVL